MIFCLSHLIAQELQALQSHARCLCVGNASSTVGNKSNIKKKFSKNYHKSKHIKKAFITVGTNREEGLFAQFFFPTVMKAFLPFHFRAIFPFRSLSYLL